MKTTIINYNRDDLPHHKSDWVDITRDSIWGNPYKIGKDGTREEVIEKYKIYLLTKPYLMSIIHELKGKVLVCSCKPKPCHGDVLIEILEED